MHEGINARARENSALAGRRFDLVVADVSFISLTLVLPQLPALLAASGDMLLLVKPQFEVGPAGIGKGGIVRDAALYAEVEAKLRACCSESHLRVCDWFDSPITGTDGNREFFLHLRHEKD
jgi:23S rRNA (cytidine1920-2'-O)/16S rRNA (cytidine1409-2'-O)-methyltransferase